MGAVMPAAAPTGAPSTRTLHFNGRGSRMHRPIVLFMTLVIVVFVIALVVMGRF